MRYFERLLYVTLHLLQTYCSVKSHRIHGCLEILPTHLSHNFFSHSWIGENSPVPFGASLGIDIGSTFCQMGPDRNSHESLLSSRTIASWTGLGYTQRLYGLYTVDMHALIFRVPCFILEEKTETNT